jgi:hypothetical protein
MFSERILQIDYSSVSKRAAELVCQLNSKKWKLEIQKMLLEGLNSGKSKPMTMARKKRIYKQALGS